jgi:protein-export membrane protein SecD
MLFFSRWKIWAIVASVVLSVLLALPNVLPKDQQDWLKQNTIARPMTLGLDLQGGSNVLLEVDRADYKANQVRLLAADARNALRNAKLQTPFSINRGENGVTIRITDATKADAAATVLQGLNQQVDSGILGSGVPVSLYEFSRNGSQFTLQFSEAGLDAQINRAAEQSLRIIERRVNELGTTEPVIQRQGKDRIVLQLPGIENPDQVKEAIGQTAKLTFQLLCESQPTGEKQNPPPDCDAYPLKKEIGQSEADQAQMLWVKSTNADIVDGADLTDAQPGFDQNNEPIVTFRFNQAGALKFGKLTTDNVGKPFAIILDGEVQSYPRINEPILGGSGQISGSFTPEQTNTLAVTLRSGALPAKLTIVEERTVGPSLGSDSIRAGWIASIIGLVGILIFMVVAYGTFGFFANLALVINLLLVIALMSVFGFTLTLPGIAGIVLTMGMAVDSNVLVFERIREEWRNGRSALNAIETGFKAALATVVDANVTTLIAAIVLFGLGSGPVRGFAVTLALGIFTTMYTAFTLTRLIIALWVKRTRPKEVPLG